MQPGDTALDVYQFAWFTPDSTFLYREQNIVLPILETLQLSLYLPYTNTLALNHNQSQTGDFGLSLNHAWNWIPGPLLWNGWFELRTGTGAKYDDQGVFSLNNYGYSQWITGVIFFWKQSWVSHHFNFFYIGYMHQKSGENEPGLLSGLHLNVLQRDSWERWLGFNPQRKGNFFYGENFNNDALEINYAINTSRSYPFVPFIEISNVLPFSFSTEAEGVPGINLPLSILSSGTRIFFPGSPLSLKFTGFFSIPYGEQTSYGGAGLGARLEF